MILESGYQYFCTKFAYFAYFKISLFSIRKSKNGIDNFFGKKGGKSSEKKSEEKRKRRRSRKESKVNKGNQ